MSRDSEKHNTYLVVINHEEQYSLWPTTHAPPSGWRSEGFVGTRQDCLGHIARVWTDMRPLSLRHAMERQDAFQIEETPSPAASEISHSLVDRLCSREHPVIAKVHPDGDRTALVAAIHRGYVQLRFLGDHGDTQVGVKLLEPLRATAPEEAASNDITLIEGDLQLDFVPLRCVARLNMETLSGVARLHRSE